MDSKLKGDIAVVAEQTNIPDGDLVGGAEAENHASGHHGGENSHLYRDARHELPNEEALPLRNVIDATGDRFEGEDNLPSPVIPGPAPPDGGLRAWIVMIASFLCNGIIFGTVNSLGVIFVELKRILEAAEEENPATIASITLSLAIGMTFLLSMVAGVLTDKLGIRVTTIAGGAIATLGMFLSSMYFTQPSIFLVTLGILVGTGSSLAYTPSLVILGHYFYKRIGFVNGVVTTGSSIFTILLTQMLTYVIEKHSLKAAFQILSGLMAVLMLCGFIFKPLMPDISSPDGTSDDRKKKTSAFLNKEIWKNCRFVIWAIAIPSALFGYFVPYVHLVAYSNGIFGKDSNSQILVQSMALTSGLGRLFFGLISDKPWVNRIVLQQISFFSIGSLTILLTAANKFWMFIVISLLMGLFDGCFISLLGPIAFDIVGPTGASQAIGFLLAFCSIPLTFGPFFAGYIYDIRGSYVLPFLLAGIPPILGAFALFLIRCVKQPSEGPVGSPKHDATEMKNNLAVANPDVNSTLLESQALMPNSDNHHQSATDLLQVDVRLLVNVQRESSV